MASPRPRLQRFQKFSASSQMSTVDLEEIIPTPVKTRGVSPSSIRCFPEANSQTSQPKRRSSLSSSMRSQNSLTSSPEHARRKVGFEAWVGVKNTISRYELSDEERQSYWLQDTEYQRIRRRNRSLIRHAEEYCIADPLPSLSCNLYEDCEYDIEKTDRGHYLCMRGLESGTKIESMRKKTNRRNSIQRVLIEQEFQCLQGFHDDEAISEIYTEATSPCKFRAVHLAMEDRIAIED